MEIPTTIIHDVFDNPEQVVELSKQFDYYKDQQYPGLRTNNLVDIFSIHFIHDLFHKVFASFLTEDQLQKVSADNVHVNFQRIPLSIGDGIIHEDENDITSIFYLSDDIIDCGTSIHERCDIGYEHSDELRMAQDSRLKHHDSFDKPTEEWNNIRNKHNSKYPESIRSFGTYNSAITFNGWRPHKQNSNLVLNDPNKERLSLICFWGNICSFDIANRSKRSVLL